MNESCWALLNTPIGPLTVSVAADGALTGIDLAGTPGEGSAQPNHCAVVMGQLQQYFAGQRQTFDLPIRSSGSAFQQQVWQALRQIPFGRAVSYGALAASLQRPGAARAVGQANGANPIPIVVPCHRVIAADGSLGGFSGGLTIKRWLLDHEGVSLRPRR